MKKFSKIVLGTAAVFGVLGCGFTVAGAAMGASVEDLKYEGSSMQKAVNGMVRIADHWDEDDDWDYGMKDRRFRQETTGRMNLTAFLPWILN